MTTITTAAPADPDDRHPEAAGVRDTIAGLLDFLAPYDTEADGQDPEDSP